MSRIQQVFENKETSISFMTVGDPDLSTTEALMPTMAEASADLVELGVPLSDLMTRGIVIQEIDLRSSTLGITTDKVFDTVHRIHQRTDVLLAFMTYINPVFAYGVDKLTKNAVDCGMGILIVSDMPPEEREELLPACRKYDMTLVYLMAPASRERAQAIARESDGSVYYVSSLGVTDVRSETITNIKEMVDTVKQGRDVPCVIRFGISTPEQASRMASQAGGVIVGNVIMKMIARYGINCVEPVCDYVKQMRAAVGV